MKKSVQNLLVISNQKLNRDHTLLELKSEVPLSEIAAGQFANILVDKTSNVFLRRPFSIYQVDYKCNSISVLIKAIGEGTNCLANSKVGESLSVIFPLGQGYSVPQKKSRVLMVGGGVGIAPLMLLSSSLCKDSHQIAILIGAKSAGDLVQLDVFGKYGKVHTTTEDGSHGTKGFVTDHSLLLQDLKLFDRIYTCGPEPMMKAVANIAYSNNIPCEVSLENTMACGFGVCLCCVTETVLGHRCVCTDGPVFDIKLLKWQN